MNNSDHQEMDEIEAAEWAKYNEYARYKRMQKFYTEILDEERRERRRKAPGYTGIVSMKEVAKDYTSLLNNLLSGQFDIEMAAYFADHPYEDEPQDEAAEWDRYKRMQRFYIDKIGEDNIARIENVENGQFEIEMGTYFSEHRFLDELD